MTYFYNNNYEVQSNAGCAALFKRAISDSEEFFFADFWFPGAEKEGESDRTEARNHKAVKQL